MKTPRPLAVFAILALALALALAAVPGQAADTYTLDPVHTSLVFSIKHLGVSWVWGRFNQVEGSYVLDRKDEAACSVSLTVDAASVDTHVEKRDEHLRSADFFNVEKFPKITFTSTSLKSNGPCCGEITGDLTLLGVTRTITAPVRMTGEGADPWGGFRTGFSTEFTLNRSDFGMTSFLPKMVGDTVNLTLDVEGTRPRLDPEPDLDPDPGPKPEPEE
ncbi:MAG: YceI family protein [Proteobacteria bacterium]|nr:YceI family protein [Pseudomonadota bacterium]